MSFLLGSFEHDKLSKHKDRSTYFDVLIIKGLSCRTYALES
jgi:hypothetical protein